MPPSSREWGNVGSPVSEKTPSRQLVNRGNGAAPSALGASIKDYCGVSAWKGSKNSRFDGWGNPSARAWGMSRSLANRSNASWDSHTSTVRHPPSDVGPHTWISSPSGEPLRPKPWVNCIVFFWLAVQQGRRPRRLGTPARKRRSSSLSGPSQLLSRPPAGPAERRRTWS